MKKSLVENWVDNIVEECAVSLRACREHHPGLNVTEIVLAGDSPFPMLEQALNRGTRIVG